MEKDYIGQWGQLTINGVQLSSLKTGEAVQLKGWSSFGNYDENCLKSGDDLQRMKGMGANCVRIAKYFHTNYGMFSDDKVLEFVDLCAQFNMYCVVDWHILEKACGSGNPNTFTSDAQSFFTKVAQHVAQKGYVHVIYELCNEPSGCSAADIKRYAETIINTIAQYDTKKPIVIVGTPNWDQYIYTQTVSGNNTITTDKANVMYAFHLYANEPAHKQLLNTEFLPATQKVPVFVSEWGLSSAEPELVHGNIWDDVNTGVANNFVSMCNGEGGSGQKVSWMNWSYGNKPEGSSTFKSGCSAGSNDENLSPSGKWVVGVLGGKTNPSIVRGAAYGGKPYTLSKTSKEQMLDLYLYDQNPEAEEDAVGGAADVTYYDANNTPDENFVKGEVYDPYKLVDALDHDAKGNKTGNVIQCYAGRAWCNTRKNECVDLTGARIDGEWGAATGLSWISSGEWLNYTFKVEDPGYYSLEMAVGNGNIGYGSAKMDPKTGELTYTAGASFSMLLVDHASQTFMVDIDESTETKEVSIEESTDESEFVPMAVTTDLDQNKLFVPCSSNETGTFKANHGILFKEAGTHVVRLLFTNGFSDQLGALRFSYAKPWTGEGYPEEVKTAVEDATDDAEAIKIYPSVVENGEFNVEVEGAAQVVVTNMTGAIVYSSNINGNSTINANLAAGVYNVKVVAADDVKTAKIIVK